MAEKFTVAQFIEAIPGTLGIISAIAARVGCDWHTAKKYIEGYTTIKQAYTDEVERITDLAETELYKAIKGGDLSAVKYYLSTKGKSRGYVERQEHTGADGGSVTVRIIDEAANGND